MRRITHTGIFLFFAVTFILFSCISLWRFNTGQVFFYDFGHFARIVWLISRFLPPVIDHKVLGEIHFFGDHFSPSVYILAPLFWITGKLQILLIEQALATVISGFLIYKIALKEKIGLSSAFIISFIYLLFAGVESPLVSDWHSESTAVVFLLLFIYLFFYRKSVLPGIISALIFMSFKDSNSISLFFILIPYFIVQKKRRKEIALLMLSSFVWFSIVGYVLSPFIAKQPYLYSPILPSNPFEFITNFFNIAIKRKLLFDSFSSFGFLPP